MTKIWDLSQQVENGMPYFPGDPVPHLEPASAAAPWLVSELVLGSHSGTHIDAPAHFFADGKTIDQIEVGRFVVPGLVAPVPGLQEDEEITAAALAAALRQLPKGGGVIIRTDWSRFWGNERYFRHPWLSAGAAAALVQAGAGLVGIDALNVDSTVRETSQTHKILLGNEVLIVENLNGLTQLETGRIYTFSFLPLLLNAADGSPVRAVAWEA